MTQADDARTASRHLPAYATTRRAGDKPLTTPTNPHSQLSQNAPVALQESVFSHVRDMPGVSIGPSLVSVPGARAFHLNGPDGPRDAFMVGREFAHLHPPKDGSLHAALPQMALGPAIANGWAEPHPLAGRFGLPANIVMIYGPRDEEELRIVLELMDAAHGYASSRP